MQIVCERIEGTGINVRAVELGPQEALSSLRVFSALLSSERFDDPGYVKEIVEVLFDGLEEQFLIERNPELFQQEVREMTEEN